MDLIDRQAAIDSIVNTVSRVGLHDNSEVARYGATFRQHEIIDIIESLPSSQVKLDENDMPEQGDSAKFGVKTGETCTDCISRKAAIDAVRSYMADNEITDSDWHADGIAYEIKRLPTAQPERKKWIEKMDDGCHGGGYAECSVCGRRFSWGGYYRANRYFRYCPNCGARMEVQE